MKKTIASIALAGIIWVLPMKNHLFIGEDTNKDEIEDTRKVYELKGIDPSGYLIYEHIKTYKDLNNNLKFDPDEEVWSLNNLKI